MRRDGRPLLPRWTLVVGLLSILGLAGAGASYWRYKNEWLRDQPKVNPCLLAAERRLPKVEPISGVEAHATPTGETVYLRPTDDRAASCMRLISRPVSAQLAEAYAIVDEEPRAQALAAVLADVRARHPDDEALIYATYMLTAPAMVGEAPPVKEAKRAIVEDFACRYDNGDACARRPGMPVVVYALGVPGALGLATLLGALGRVGFIRIRGWYVARRERKRAAAAAASPSSVKKASKEK